MFFAGSTRLTSNTNNITAKTNFAGITFNSGAGAFTLSGNALTLGGNVTNSSTNLQTIDLAMVLSATRTFNAASGSLDVGGIISSSGGLTKTGAGTLTLSGTNTYTGVTTLTAGTLVINGNQSAATGLVAVSNAGTRLSGTGTVGGNTTINSGGMHAPGEVGAVGKLTFDQAGAATTTLTYNTGSIFEWDLHASTSDTRVGETYDQVVATGAVTGSSIFTIVLGTNAFTDVFWKTSKTWTDIFTGTGSYTLKNIFTSFAGTGIGTGGTVQGQGYNGLFTFQSGTNTLTWSPSGAYDVVPEPGGVLAGLLLAAGLLRRRR